MNRYLFLPLVASVLFSALGFGAELNPKRAPAETIFDLPGSKSTSDAIIKKSFKIGVHNFSRALSNDDLIVVVTLKCIHPTSSSSIRQIWGGEPNYSVMDCGTEIIKLRLDAEGVATVPNLTFQESDKIDHYSIEVDLAWVSGDNYRFVSHGSTRRYSFRSLSAQRFSRLDFSIYEVPAVEFKVTPPVGETPSSWLSDNTVTAETYFKRNDGSSALFDILTNIKISTKEFPVLQPGRYVVMDGDLGRDPTALLRMKYVDRVHFLPDDPYTRCSGVLLQKQIKYSELAETLNALHQAKSTPCHRK